MNFKNLIILVLIILIIIYFYNEKKYENIENIENKTSDINTKIIDSNTIYEIYPQEISESQVLLEEKECPICKEFDSLPQEIFEYPPEKVCPAEKVCPPEKECPPEKVCEVCPTDFKIPFFVTFGICILIVGILVFMLLKKNKK